MGRRRKRDRHLPWRMYAKHGGYYFARPAGGWEPLGHDYSAALAKYLSLVLPDRPTVTMGDLIDRYLRETSPTKSPRTHRNELAAAKPLRVFFGQMLPAEVRPVHVVQYRDARDARTQVNRELSLLSSIFYRAVELGLAQANPCRDVKRARERPRDRLPTEAEIAAFLAHAPALVRAYVRLKRLIGVRQGDMLALRRDALQADGVHVMVGKTRQRKIYEWTDELRASVAEVDALPRPVRSLYLFSTRRGQPYSGDGFRSIWQRAMRAALDSGELGERFTEHDLRARAGTDVELAGGDPQAFLGHEERATTAIYLRHRAPKRVRPAK